jgi:phage recombination protein Bet
MKDLVQQPNSNNELDRDKIRVNFCQNATPQEFEKFMELAKYRKLNPFLGEIYFVKYGSSPGNIIVGKGAIIKNAKKKPSYRGYRSGYFSSEGKRLEFPVGNIAGAWCEVIDKVNEPLFVAVLRSEYDSGKSTWKQIPYTMIRKVAVCQAHREFAPEETEGMYEREEMSRAIEPDVKNITPSVSKVAPLPPTKKTVNPPVKIINPKEDSLKASLDKIKSDLRENYSELTTGEQDQCKALAEKTPDDLEGWKKLSTSICSRLYLEILKLKTPSGEENGTLQDDVKNLNIASILEFLNGAKTFAETEAESIL